MHERPARFLLYSHDSYGLGHIRRTLAIAWGLATAFPRSSLLCITGSPRAHSFPFPPRTDYLRLPAVTKDDGGRYVPRGMNLSFSQLLALRTVAIDASIRAYQPHLILVDHAPLGMGGELTEALRRVRQERPSTRIVLGLRDIYDDGPLVREAWQHENVPAFLEEVYDRILVYGQPDIFDVAREYALGPAVARKLVYTGYVHRTETGPEQPVTLPARLGSNPAPLVLVTVGGGEDGHGIVRQYLEGLAALGSDCPWRSLVVLGPLMTQGWQQALGRGARSLPGLVMLDFTPRLCDCMAAADVILTMGGYNTLVEALALQKRIVVMPRVSFRKEQLVRAQRFSRRGLLRWSDPRSSAPFDLVGAVKAALSGPEPPAARGLDLGGVARTLEAVAELLGNSRAARLWDQGRSVTANS